MKTILEILLWSHKHIEVKEYSLECEGCNAPMFKRIFPHFEFKEKDTCGECGKGMLVVFDLCPCTVAPEYCSNPVCNGSEVPLAISEKRFLGEEDVWVSKEEEERG